MIDLKTITLIVAMVLFTGSLQGQGINANQPIPVGFEAMAKVEKLPILFPPGTKKNRIVSYDASGGNGFGLFQSMFKRYIDERGEVVFFDAYGPGCLYREQMNIWTDFGVGVKNKNIRIRFYFDDDDAPRIDVPVYEFFNGEHTPGTAPFTFRDGNMFGIGYYPFCFAKRLRITLADPILNQMIEERTETTCNWYQFDYLTYPVGVSIKSWTPGINEYEKEVRKQWAELGEDPKNTDSNLYTKKKFSLNPGESMIAFEYEGQASIAGIQFQMNPFDAETFCQTHIQIWWDNLAEPAVDMPISYFFGAGGANDKVWDNALKNLLFGFDAKNQTVYCYWPMPFWEKAVIKLVNKSRKRIDSINGEVAYTPVFALNYPKEQTGYFKAKITKDSSPGGLTRKDFAKPYANAFQEEGYGHLVAINMWSGNFYEDGDEFTYIDGSCTPQIHGDGTEDDFNQGWAGGCHQKALWGALNNGVKGAYRIYLNEPYIFYRSIDMRFEYTNSVYGGESPRKRLGTDNSIIETEFVAWYYHSSGGKTLVLSDSVDVGDWKSEKAHTYKISGSQRLDTLTQGYDSYESRNGYNILTDNGRSFKQFCEFKAKIDAGNNGVRLRQRINRNGNGLQTAIVYVDGKKLDTPWNILTYSSPKERGDRLFDGWFDCEYEIPAVYTKGKKKINIRIEHQCSLQGELNAYYYWIYSYCSRRLK